MKKMKRNLCTVLAMCLSLSLAACGYGFDDSKSESSSSETETTSAATSPDETEPTSSESTETTTDCEPFSEVSVTDSKTEQQGGSDEGNSSFQQQFKSDSIKEYYSVLDEIRIGITLNREHEPVQMIVKQAVTLINWSRGTTLTSSEIESEWNNYTSGWEKSDYEAFETLYALVYKECNKIVNGEDNDTLAELGYSYSDFEGLNLPLEAMDTLNRIV